MSGEPRAGLGRPAIAAFGAAGLAAGLAVAAVALRIRGVEPSLDHLATAGRVVPLFGLAAVLPTAAYLLQARRRSDPRIAAERVLLGVVITLLGLWGFAVADAVRFRADILLWSEGDFLGDLIKLSVGHPVYAAPSGLESLTYTPGAPMLSGALAALFGSALSVPALRMVQVGYMALAACAGALTVRRLLAAQEPGRSRPPSLASAMFWTVTLMLVAGNAITNPFSHLLHNDSLALLVSVVTYWILVEYATGPGGRGWLVALALMPGIGFWVKQSLAIWAPLAIGYLFVFDRRLRWPGLVAFGVAAFGSIAAAVLAGYLAWGGNFFYWVFGVMGKHGVSPLRGLEHLIATWAYSAALGLAGLVLLPRRGLGRLTGLWLVAAGLFAIELYTSGIAWMLNHMGPGSFLAGVWLLAALHHGWLGRTEAGEPADPMAWGRALLGAAVVALAFSGLGLVRPPQATIPPDAQRYARAIEREFEGVPADRVMLDYGTWVYVPSRTVSQDHAAGAGEGGYTETADFSGLLSRIREHHYAKILVRDYHGPDLAYDHGSWAKSSGIRAALAQEYHEVRQIPAVAEDSPPPWFKTISVLEPNDRTEPVGGSASNGE